MKTGIIFLLLVIAAVVSWPGFSRAQDSCNAPVETTSGLLRGAADGETGTCVWRGIPFAAPPVGGLRWKAPREPEAWQGVRDAKEFGPACTQYGGLMAIMDCEKIGGLVGDEDCLYLNIWRPGNMESGLPVFFWIYGGGNTVGQSAMSLYNGANFAAGSNMVFVSINYRLGPMGWFAHPALRTGDALDDSGNYGTLDIIRALEWVRDNIASFGGDPGNVTIAGESAGGINVFSMMASPLAAGLFHRAVAESGAPFSVPIRKGEEQAQALLIRLIVKDGLAVTNDDAERFLAEKDDEWVASYMRSKTAAEIYSCCEVGTFGSISGTGEVFVDGTVLVKGSWASLKSGDYNRVPLIAGSNAQEAKLFLPLVLTSLEEKELCELIRDIDPENPDIRLLDYTNPFYLAIYGPISQVSGRGFQVAGVDLPSRIMRKHQDDIYIYRFKWDEEPEPMDFVVGSAHALEMPFIFGNFQTDEDSVLRFAWSEANGQGREELSKRMMSYWANFARTGNPNGPGLPEWKQAPRRMVFDAEY